MFDVHVVVFPVKTCQAIDIMAVFAGGKNLPKYMIPEVVATRRSGICRRISINSYIVEM